MSILEGLERHQLGKLSAQHLGMSSQLVSQDLGCLLILGEVTTLVEAARVGRVHEKVGRPVQLNDKPARSRWRAVSSWRRFTRFQLNALDKGERVFDLVASGIIVDIVRDAGFVRRVEDDQVHGVLTHPSPRTDAQRSTGEVLNDLKRLVDARPSMSRDYLPTLP